MALTKVGPAGIGSTPGTGYVIGDSFLHSTGLDSTNAKFTGIVTAQTFRVLGNFQVDGTTTTLDTEITSVDKLEVAANNTTVGVAITQSGTGDILNLYDGSSEVFTVRDGGNVGIKNATGLAEFAVDVGGEIASKNANKEFIGINLTSNEARIRSSFYSGASGAYRPITFYTSDVERLRITSGGSVGINKNAPTSVLDVRQTNTGAATEIKLFNLDQTNATTQTAALVMTPDVRANGVKIVAVKEVADMSLSANKDLALTFQTVSNNTATERLRITSAGNIGIGDNSPDHELVVRGSQPFLEIRDNRNQNWSQNDVFSGILFSSEDVYGGNQNQIPHGFIKAVHTRAGSNHSTSDAGLTFGTSASTTSAATERLRITSGGNIGIGTDNPQSELHLNGATTTSLLRFTSGTYGTASTDGSHIGISFGGLEVWHKENNYLRFATNNTERLRITSGGDVNVGNISNLVASGAGKLNILADDTTNLGIATDGAINIACASGSGVGRVQSINWVPGFNVTLPTASIGYVCTDAGAYGKGDLFFATRGATTNTAATERLRITSAGNVGINDTNPNYSLVVGGQDQAVMIRQGNGALAALTHNTSQKLWFQGGNAELGLFSDASGNLEYILGTWQSVTHIPLVFRTGNRAERMRITFDGKVGIGLTNPGALLHLESTAANAARLRIGFDSPRYYDIFRGSTTNSGYLNFYGSQSSYVGYTFGGVDGEWMRIKTDGKVGIGTDNPTALLDIDHPHTERGLLVRCRYGNIGSAMVKFDADPLSNNGDGNVLHIHGGNSRTDSEILQVDSTGCGDIFQIRGDGLIKQTLTKNNFTESHWYNHTANAYKIEYDNNDVLTITKQENTSGYDRIVYRRIQMSKNCDIEFDLKGNAPSGTNYRHVGFIINGDGGNTASNQDRLVFRYRPSNNSNNQIRIDKGGGGTGFNHQNSNIPNFFDGTYRHILIQIRDRVFRIYSDGVLVNSYRSDADLVRGKGWFGITIFEQSSNGNPNISLKNFSIRNEFIKPNFLVKATGVNVDIAQGSKFPFNSRIHDPGDDYDTSNYYFTAPVHGLYYLFFNIYRNSSTGTVISLYVNSSETIQCRPHPQTGDYIFSSSGLLNLNKGDQVSIRAETTIDNFYGNNEQRRSSFGGYLVD